jgi:DNA-binding NtrC family response regulator
VPALAERSEDVLPLARHFLDADHTLTEDAERALRAYAWPGNVRELQNCIKRACLLSSGSRIDASMLGLQPGGEMPNEPDEKAIREALEDSNAVVAKAARALGISRQALYRRMQKYGIEQSDRR